MKKLIPFIVLTALVCTSCQYGKDRFIADIKINDTYDVNKTGPFTNAGNIDLSLVRANTNVPYDATIEEVNIEAISVKVIVSSDNVATAVSLSGKLRQGSTNIEVFNNFPAALSGVDFPEIGLNSLIEAGVDGIKSKISNYLMGTDTTPLNFDLSGDSSPLGGQRMHIQIQLKITGSVKYAQCVEMPIFISGEPCMPLPHY